MKIQYLVLITLVAGAARADFSYLMSRDGTAGSTNGTTKYYYKSQKLAIQTGSHTSVIDFDSQTVTGIDSQDRTYTVSKFGDIQGTKNGSEDVKMDVKETGVKKIVNGYNASQLLITTTMDSPDMQKRGMSATAEIEIWISPDPPGASEVRAFYQRNGAKVPWTALSEGAPNQSIRAAMVEMYKKMTQMNGIPVQQVVHVKMGGGTASQAQAAQSDPRMAQARAQLEAMAKQGGAQGDAAQKALARMGGASGGAPGGMDTTMTGGAYSTASIPDSVFAVPAGYTQKK